MKRRIPHILFLTALVCLLLSVSASATIVDSGTFGDAGDNLTWTLDENGLLTISGTGRMAFEYDYGPWWRNASNITSVVIQDGVTDIGYCAFERRYPALQSVTIPDTVTTIGRIAFNCCSRLKEVIFPATLKSIGASAFSGCGPLKNMIFTGDAPTIDTSAFSSVTANLCYPSDNATWDNAAYETSGGTFTWIAVTMPTIMSQPEDTLGYTGENAVFSVRAVGSVLKYQWQYRSPSASDWSNSSAAGAKTASFSVEAAAYRSGYRYRCIVTDKYGTQLISNAATLSVSK